jgi:hypothetical protein
MKQLIEDLISAMEYHVEQTRPIRSTTVALQAAREALRAQPAVQELVECQYGNGGYACCEGGPCKADEQNNAAQPAPTVQEPVAWLELLREARDNCKASIAEDGISAMRKEYRVDLERRLTAALTTPPAAQPAPVQPVAFEVGLVEWVGNKLMATPKVTTTPPASWMEMVTANLVREGVNKHKARELAEHFYSLAQRQWVGLTDEEAQWIYDNGRTPSGMMEMVEAKLRSKNNG